jgi:hypothetical protein
MSNATSNNIVKLASSQTMTHYQNKSFEIYSSKTTHSTVERTGINTRSSKLKQADPRGTSTCLKGS